MQRQKISQIMCKNNISPTVLCILLYSKKVRTQKTSIKARSISARNIIPALKNSGYHKTLNIIITMNQKHPLYLWTLFPTGSDPKIKPKQKPSKRYQASQTSIKSQTGGTIALAPVIWSILKGEPDKSLETRPDMNTKTVPITTVLLSDRIRPQQRKVLFARLFIKNHPIKYMR